MVFDQELLQCLLPFLYLGYNIIHFLDLNKLALLTPFSLLPMGLLTFSSPLAVAKQNGYIVSPFTYSSFNFLSGGFDNF